jgi:hypothetical protein
MEAIMRKVPHEDYRAKAERLLKAIEQATDGRKRQRLESAASTYLTLAEMIGWGEKPETYDEIK